MSGAATGTLKPLRTEQAAASAPQAHVWLSASAGTGKTHVLTARVFRLLLNGVPPERILCLTFTKAGAAEMANRVHERLAAWVRMDDVDLFNDLEALGEPSGPDARDKARLLFARVLEATGGGLKIQTIHSFCQTLLGAFPLEAGLVPGFRPLDDRGQGELARSTLVELIVQAEESGDTGLLDALATLSLRLGEGDAERYLMRCAKALAALDDLPDDLPAHMLALLDLPDGDLDAIIEAECGDDRFDCESLRRISAANAEWGTATGLANADAIAAWLAGSPGLRAANIAAIRSVVLTKDGKPKAVPKKIAATDPGYEGYAQRVAEACQSLEDLRVRVAYARIAGNGLHAGRAFARAYAEAKRRKGAVDFDDLIAWTIGLLRERDMAEWIRYKLDQGIDHILVDEAQDTNRDQWRIVDALVEEFFAVEPEPEGPRSGGRSRTLFVVGDDKQAIFGFQGTSPEAFRTAKDGFLARALIADHNFSVLPLSESFRSTPPVLEVVDAVLADLGPDAIGLAGPAPAHLSARPFPGQVLLWKPTGGLTADGDGDSPAEAGISGEEDWFGDHVRAHATAIARQIKAWMTDGLMLASQGRPATPGDIMVLVRSRSDMARLIVARLFEEGVPVAGIDRLRLQAPLAVRDLLAAVRFAVQPHDDLNLANLLVSPLIGWDQERLMTAAIRRDKAGLWEHVRATQPDAALATLRDLLAAADLVTPYGFLEMILTGPMRGRQALLARMGAEAGDAIDELLNAAIAFEKDENPSLQHFIDWFDRGEGEIKRDLGEGGDAVRVMTVHGSKGLQAPIVILADATFKPEQQQRDLAVNWPQPDETSLPVIMPRKAERFGTIEDAVEGWTGREMQEHWRLLYVAMTRAEEVLAVGGALAPRAKGAAPDSSWHSQIERSLDQMGAAPHDVAIWGEQRVWTGSRADKPAMARDEPAQQAADPIAPPDWLHQPAPAEARPPRPLSPSAPVDDMLPYAPPSEGMRQAAARGTALHALFERLPAVLPLQRRAVADRWLERQGAVADAGERSAMIDQALAVIEDPALATLFGDSALAEAPVAATVNGVVIAGTIDRLLVEKDRVLLVDFKTGMRVPTDAGDVPPVHVRQMAAYAAALAVIFPDRRIEAGLIYTSGPRFILLDPEKLAAIKPGLDAAKDNLLVSSIEKGSPTP